MTTPTRLFARLLLTATLACSSFAFSGAAWADDAGAPSPSRTDAGAASANVAPAPSAGDAGAPSEPPAPQAPEEAGENKASVAPAPGVPAGADESAVPSSAPGPSAASAGGDEGLEDEESAKIPPRMGRVQGTIVDGANGEALIEAQVTVVQTGKKVLTDIDGNYRLNLKPGTYDLRVFAELRPARRIANVKVTLQKTTRIDVALGAGDEKKISVQVVEVVAAPDTATEAVQVVRRQKAAVVSDGVSAQQIARSPDSNASESIKRVVGATVQDGKYVVIRGLGGRYSSTLLNGVPLPSPDPDTPSAPLDLFPAALLANLTVAKTFSPDLPGNFAGGSLMIETRDFPTKLTLKLRLNGSFDSQSTFQTTYGYQGGSYDFLGYDDGGRKLPDLVPGDKPLGDPSLTQAQADAQAGSFANNWNLKTHSLAPNFGFGVTIGDSFEGKQKFGFLVSLNYGHKWVRRLTKIQRVGEPLPNGRRAASDEQLTEESGTELPSLGTLVALGWAPSPAHRINLTSFYTHNTENSAGRTTGVDNNRTEIDRLRLRFLEREMLFTQLLGEHALAPGRVLFGWQLSTAQTSQNEPDSRDLLRSRGSTGGAFLLPRDASGASERMFGDLSDKTHGGGGDLSLLFDGAKVKTGGSVLTTSRESLVRRFHYAFPTSFAGLSNDAAFAPGQIANGLRVSEVTQPTDGYDASRDIYAAYIMTDLVKLDPLRVIVGERYEVSTLDVTVQNKADPMSPVNSVSKRTDKDLLPSANVVLAIGKENNLRAGYSRTVARPHFREIAPAQYFDYVRRRAIGGNPNLRETSIQNFDLRWESFLSPTELFAASVFYKQFKDPIERTVTSAGSGSNISFDNADKARVYGAELETRLSLKRFADALSDFSLAANLSLIQSKVDIDGASRSLQGQSPYVINVDLGYRIEKTGTQFDLLYNVFGRRISEVGTAGDFDTYEEAVHRLDATVSQKIPGGFQGKLSATNLLDQRVVNKQGDVEILAYKMGVGVFASLEWTMNSGKD